MLSPAFGWSLAPAFDAQGARIVRTPIQVPEVNGIAGRFVRTARSECFHWLLIVSAEHLECALTVYISIITTPSSAPELCSLRLLMVATQSSLAPFGRLIHEYRLRVPKILTTFFPEILATPR